MQARFAAFSALALALVAAPAFAQTAACPETERDRHIFVNNATEPQAAYVGSANGGVWKTTDGGRPGANAPATVQTPPQQGRTDALLELGGVDGESSQAPAAQQGVQSNGQGSTALLVPA